MKKKKAYVRPTIEPRVVQLEASICAGSVDVTVTSPGAATSAQEVNSAFNDQNDFLSGTSWDTAPTTNQ